MSHDDRGQAVVAWVLALTVTVLALLVIGRVGVAVRDRARARSAADAAALAGAGDDRRAAEDVAARNGARIVSYVEAGGAVEVSVEIDGMRATARARAEVAEGAP
jgi:hypothetical protein